jgi:GTPase involved in cell partitioning and DNA repair
MDNKKKSYLEEILGNYQEKLNNQDLELISSKFDSLEKKERSKVMEIFSSLCYSRVYCLNKGVEYTSLKELSDPLVRYSIIGDAYQIYMEDDIK